MFQGLFNVFKKKEKSEIMAQSSKDEAQYILLVGSESGKTKMFAKAFLKGLIKAGKSVFMDDLDNYTTYKKATHLIVFTSTFGDGDAPGNATGFEDLFQTITPINSMKFAVVGFGSTLFPNFCQFGINVNTWLKNHPSFTELIPLEKVNQQSNSEFRSWLSLWNRSTDLSVQVKLSSDTKKHLKPQEFKVIERSEINVDDTVLIHLSPTKTAKFKSGDLLQIVPPNSEKPRWYSIAKVDNTILLSVKKHESGLCSSYLCNLNIGDSIIASVEKNEKFHFPTEAPAVWLIANGTGIAPFLGMLSENNNVETYLTWGGRTENSFICYKNYIEDAYNEDRLEFYQIALSQANTKEYVQDVLRKQKDKIATAFEEGCVFMLCGSMAMQHGVLKVLNEITLAALDEPLSFFQNNNQLLKDCY